MSEIHPSAQAMDGKSVMEPTINFPVRVCCGGSSTVIASVHVYLPPSAPGELIAQMNSDARKMAFTIFHSLADRR